jgi:ABC-type uncharacterized transport system involved in gliding motility auxiliary subunit
VQPGGRDARRVRELADRYRRVKPDLELRVINPDLAPGELRQRGISRDGELVVEYAERSERLQELTEQAFTNALLRLARDGKRQVLFLAGHGERNPNGQANHDLGQFVAVLQSQGLEVGRTNPLLNDGIPEQASLLVIAGPQSDLLPGEAELLHDYLARGGNLLWLQEPQSELHGLEALARQLGVERFPGRVVDEAGLRYGIGDPSFVVVADYAPHPATDGFAEATLYPQVAALAHSAIEGWQATVLVETAARSWTESGPLDGALSFDAGRGEQRGPLALAIAWQRPRPGAAGEQRVVVVGDGDFLANAYLGNGGNLAFGLRLVNWLVADDRLLAIPPRTAIDRTLELSRSESLLIGGGFLLLLPGAILVAGMGLWWRRRRR